jgi:integrase
MEQRLATGRSRIEPTSLVFGRPDGKPVNPDYLSRDWSKFIRTRSLPDVTFHALRHTHASALIAGGADVVRVSRRLGHSGPAITLQVYAHQFDARADVVSANAIEAALIGSAGAGKLPSAR